MNLLDAGATLAAATSIIFLFRKSLWYWYVGLLANTLWLLLFSLQGHYLAAGLQVAYIAFTGYAIARWQLEQRRRRVPYFLEYIGNGIALAALLIALTNTHFTALYAYFEFVAVSLFVTANWLTAHKRIACWYFWMAGNMAFAVFLWQTHNYFTFAGQFLFFGLSVHGLLVWLHDKQAAGQTD